ncbi:MAG: hypothetical protein ACJ757_09230 [Gaiellaceae bacterium]
MSPYVRLVELVLREAELVEAGAWTELEAVARERRELVATLPARPPADARAQLEEAARIVAATGSSISSSLALVQAQLDRFREGRSVTIGYRHRPRALLNARG